jgi:hypothetical protein
MSACCPPGGKRGQAVVLHFYVFDDSKSATETVRILDAGHTIATLRFRFAAVAFNRPRSAKWLVPRSLKPGVLQACVTASDPSGNRSREVCVPLRIV